MSDLSELLAKSPLFSNNIMGNKVTAQSQVNVMMNHFGVVADSDPTSPGSQAERFFTNKISAEVGFSAIVNEVANFLSTDNVPTEFAEVAALLDNKALVSKAYVETNPPDDFALTTEIGNLVGSSGNDIFIGDKNTTSVADTLVGGDGKNILQLSSANIAPNNSSRIEKVLYTTPDGDISVADFSDVNSVQGRSMTLLANGDYSYTPAVGFFGADSFDYIVNDGNGASDIGTVNITVNEISSPPAPVEIIVDNQDSSQTSISGSWTPSSGTGPHAGNSVYANSNGESFTWGPDLSPNGVHEIATWWTYWNNRDESVTY